MSEREGLRAFLSYAEAFAYLKQLQESGQNALMVVVQTNNGLLPLRSPSGTLEYRDFGPATTRIDPRQIDVSNGPRNFVSLIPTLGGGYAWEYANHGQKAAYENGVPMKIIHSRRLPTSYLNNIYVVIPGSLTKSPLIAPNEFPADAPLPAPYCEEDPYH